MRFFVCLIALILFAGMSLTALTALMQQMDVPVGERMSPYFYLAITFLGFVGMYLASNALDGPRNKRPY